ncbi:mitochondrial 54S ribosomal protein YmL41 [Saxophila tyrrhenica]|uniref:Large ribosomal subunit protein uL23m n=1 Tax=Saxophila tyrrhenica TaxID=1690608 RepID=A0AAV9P014_9PEZI|nr:mitochondrial 54S ribosomal protein YmL41 [Saxophila tyrrhenica]
MAMATRASLTPFRVGTKELHLPDISITLLRTANSPAHTAKFQVPPWFSKLDLRDYLFHVYDVRILSVRSYVKQSRVQEGDPKIPRPQPSRWHRPRPTKFMTVELERPFVWPEEPEDYAEWNKGEMEESEEEQKKLQESLGPTRDTIGNEERRTAMRDQAKALLEGRVKWKPVAEKGSGRLLGR